MIAIQDKVGFTHLIHFDRGATMGCDVGVYTLPAVAGFILARQKSLRKIMIPPNAATNVCYGNVPYSLVRIACQEQFILDLLK